MTWRQTNLALAIAWSVMVPVSLVTGWVYSVAFVSLASIYANAATHLAGWRADSPSPDEAGGSSTIPCRSGSTS